MIFMYVFLAAEKEHKTKTNLTFTDFKKTKT